MLKAAPGEKISHSGLRWSRKIGQEVKVYSRP